MDGNSKTMLWVVDGFAVGTPAQQWVDHFLIGHPRDGAWIRPAGWRHVLLNVQGGDNAALQERRTRFGLELAREMPETSAAVVAGQDDGAEPRGDVLDRVLADGEGRYDVVSGFAKPGDAPEPVLGALLDLMQIGRAHV